MADFAGFIKNLPQAALAFEGVEAFFWTVLRVRPCFSRYPRVSRFLCTATADNGASWWGRH